VWGNVGASCEAVYSASKGAINSFTKALAKELAPSNIQVNAIAFGAIETPMNAWLSKEEAEALADEIPAGREGTKEEAAQMICMVADAPDYLTGQILTMDGGWI
ncbi:MAG: SDR family oxidoreductase, partial [Clostridiales bacterium]|nr:SDR family oxidoreductase [Clostridiales bacterium]